MATFKQYTKSKTNRANVIYLAVIAVVHAWNIPFVEQYLLIPEVIGLGSLILNAVMRKFTKGPLEDKGKEYEINPPPI